MGKKSSEALLISSLLRSKNHIPVISSGLEPEMFHAFTDEWEWVTNYVSRHRRLPSKRAFKDRFGDFTIYKVDDTDYYVEQVKEDHIQFVLIEEIDDAVSQLQAGTKPKQVLESLGKAYNFLSAQSLGTSSETNIIEHWDSVYQDAVRRVVRANEFGTPGIPTGFETLDVATGGIQPGQMFIVAARLGVGKTWTAISIAVNALVNGFTPLYFSLEQSKAQIGFRTHTFLSQQLQYGELKNHALNKGEGFSLLEYKRFLRVLSKKLKNGFFVNDTTRGRITPEHIAAHIEAIGPDLVIIDYLTLMARETSDWQSVAKLVGDLKAVAEKYQVPMLVVSQVNRIGAGKEPPGTDHLSQSDSVGQDADAVVTIAKVSDHVVKLKLAKYRHGPDGHIWFAEFDVNRGIYREVSGDEAERIKRLDTEQP